MRLCQGARHIEVQLLGDKHGNVATLSGRDCSMQRRFQKIVEEGPPLAVPPETMLQMELAAARLCKMVDYTHAGTVEYLFIEETKQFYFLELNPRLQVEHPVTEGVTGANLPALQCMVAMGVDVSKLPPAMSISKFLLDPEHPPKKGTNLFDRTHGHTIAVRITAENAADGCAAAAAPPMPPHRPRRNHRLRVTGGSRRSAQSRRSPSSRRRRCGATSRSRRLRPRCTPSPTRNLATCLRGARRAPRPRAI